MLKPAIVFLALYIASVRGYKYIRVLSRLCHCNQLCVVPK